MTDQAESVVRKTCRERMKKSGWEVVPNPNARRADSVGGQRKGAADDVAFRQGIVAFVEYKAPWGKQSKDQEEFEAACHEHGVPYILAKSDEDLAEQLGRLR